MEEAALSARAVNVGAAISVLGLVAVTATGPLGGWDLKLLALLGIWAVCTLFWVCNMLARKFAQ